MIRDTVLVCCIVICCVLFYRMYVLNQKINNLEEKTSVLDNFSQSIFNFITQREEQKQKEELEQAVKQPEVNVKQEEVVYSNQPEISQNKLSVVQEESESDDNEYNRSNNGLGEKMSETFESKEILSEMVSELKESLIQSNMENLQKDLKQVQDLKQELKQELTSENNNEEQLFNLLSSVELESKDENKESNVKILDTIEEKVDEESLKKKEEDLNKMNLAEIKALAKVKNISVMKSNKPKKKEQLIHEILRQ